MLPCDRGFAEMGSGKSKVKFGAGKGQGAARNAAADSNTENREMYEDAELQLLRRTIKYNPEAFILNNLMMCVQFFGNYEEEIGHLKETLASSREAELNKQLPPQKHILLPDVLQDHIARNVGFISTRQTFRPTIEPLQPVRIYTVHDNFDITEESYSPHYSSVNDTVMYSLRLRPSEHQGYVQLQLLDEMPQLKSHLKEDEMDLSSTTRDEDEIYSDGDSVYGPKPISGMILGRQTNTMRSSKCAHTRSLPNLYDDEIYTDRRPLSPQNLSESRSTHNVKFGYDEENGSSAEEHQYRNRRNRSRGELTSTEARRHPRQVSRGKRQQVGNYSRASSTSSGYRSGNYAVDSDSSYNASHNLNTAHSSCSVCSDSTYVSKSIDKLDDSSIETAELPRKCFRKVTYTVDGKIYDPKEENKQLLNSKQRRIKQALRRQNYDVTYVNSAIFMKHFMSLFVYRLAEPMGFDKEAVENVKREGCVIYCDKITNEARHSKIEQYEITPSVWLEWPECAEEWLERPRNSWPRFEDVGKIKDFGCYVVPEGFVPKRGSNALQNLEWQLTFPAAERYLETCMTQAQVQVYLIALMLHKTFMRPIFDTMFGLTTAHIRNKFFWMIEENDKASKWPDTRTGDCLLTLLNSLYYNISQNEPILRDYFVKDRNLFQKVPSEHLLHTQKQLKRIIENPVMYVLHAMENIRYSEKFFPRVNYERLLNILTLNILAVNNPALARKVNRSIHPPKQEDDKYESRTGFWVDAKIQKPQNKTYGTGSFNKTLINPHKATDSIIEIPTRCAELEGPRLCALLKFFIDHFIKIAKQCHQYKAYRQKMVYLDQVDRLSTLLYEFPTYKDDAKEYRDKIKVLGKRNCSFKILDDPPKTPKRNMERQSSVSPIFVGPLNDRFSECAPAAVKSDKIQNQAPEYSNLGNNQTPINNNILETTKVMVHEVRFETVEEQNEKNVREPKRQKQPVVINDINELQPIKEERVVSLIKSQDDSHLTETTYI